MFSSDVTLLRHFSVLEFVTPTPLTYAADCTDPFGD